MASGGITMITIDELGGICDVRCSLALGWFETVGRWVPDEPHPERQRWFSTVCHRLAWHAELWAERRPAIPHDAVRTRPRSIEVTASGDRLEALGAHLIAERGALAAISARVDADLDPATLRVISLVDADLVDLLGHRPD